EQIRLPLKSHLDAVRAAVDEATARMQAVAELRAKSGRTLSADTLKKLRDIHAANTASNAAMATFLESHEAPDNPQAQQKPGGKDENLMLDTANADEGTKDENLMLATANAAKFNAM